MRLFVCPGGEHSTFIRLCLMLRAELKVIVPTGGKQVPVDSLVSAAIKIIMVQDNVNIHPLKVRHNKSIVLMP